MACKPVPENLLPRQRCPAGIWTVLLITLLSTVGCQQLAIPVASGNGSLSLQGSVHGGQQGISGAAIQMYAIGTAGDGSAAVPLLAKPVITDAAGSFSLSGLYTCPAAGATVYLVARGGNPGSPAGTTNDALGLMAMLGPCGALSTTPSISVNEVTTVGAIWPMARYMNSVTEVVPAGGDRAFAVALETTSQLANVAKGISPGNGVPDGYLVPSDKLNTLANILAACVNSGGGRADDGSTCGTLFSLAAEPGAAPVTDTITAALHIAQNPTRNVAALLHLAPISPPFQPTLSSAPVDWTLDLQPVADIPMIFPAAGSYFVGQQITLSGSSVKDVIHYTVDGTTPSAASAIYSSPLVLAAAETVRAIATNGSTSSGVAVASYTTGAAHLVFVTQPSTIAGGVAFAPAPAVEVVDASGALISGASSAVSLSLKRADGVSAALSGSASAMAIHGVASFPQLSIAEAGSGYVLQATGPGLVSQQSRAFNVVPAAVATPAAVAAPAIPPTFFGMSVNHPTTPATLPYGTTRSWDADGMSWAELNPASGTFNFAPLDAFVAKNQAHGTQIIYTFGRTPQWASSQPNAPGPYGPGQCAPPANLSAWDNYVRAIVTHVAGQIKYWEIWNEPNNPGFYCGQVSTMIVLAQHASAIIKSIDPTALVLAPALTSSSGPQWLGWYLLGGGGAFVDVIPFHGYSTTNPQDIVQVVANYQKVMATYGQTGKPMWNTETSWAGDGNLVTPDMPHQVAYIAKSYLLQWSLGVSRNLWYAYDGGPIWGGLWTAAAGPSAAAVAYGQVYGWMVGASLSTACAADQTGTWTCGLARPGGYVAEAIWRPNASATVAVPAQFTQYRDLAGGVHPVTPGSVVIGDQPILLESGPLAAVGLERRAPAKVR